MCGVAAFLTDAGGRCQRLHDVRAWHSAAHRLARASVEDRIYRDRFV